MLQARILAVFQYIAFKRSEMPLRGHMWCFSTLAMTKRPYALLWAFLGRFDGAFGPRQKTGIRNSDSLWGRSPRPQTPRQVFPTREKGRAETGGPFSCLINVVVYVVIFSFGHNFTEALAVIEKALESFIERSLTVLATREPG
jgi:hypothetical protein